ncbi:helix-turn-helix transcriptional regulator [Cognatishimia maritima]|uniref:WYL domain-containing protein n=1 Tax=Cognatishimia maritima TaxID=870908 RepID=A0A1M5J5H7_9RHOB|nr:HTH domain-containing protein [Cognatishimia maritima]SHG35834.1 WYL domain-containing protein [Cognatishimia maritima]
MGKSESRRTRLQAIMHRLSGGETLRAEDLASEFGVSQRSIYRDMDTLKANGMPIVATQGQGYRAAAVITLPPLHLSEQELEALHLGLLAVAASADETLQVAAQSVSEKLDAALPTDALMSDQALSPYPFQQSSAALRHLATVRSAIKSRQRLRVALMSGTRQDIRPLKLDFWGRAWIVSGYGEQAQGFVSLPVDALESATVLPGLFVAEDGKDLHAMHNAPITSLR